MNVVCSLKMNAKQIFQSQLIVITSLVKKSYNGFFQDKVIVKYAHHNITVRYFTNNNYYLTNPFKMQDIL